MSEKISQYLCKHPINRLQPSISFPEKWITCMDCEKYFILSTILAYERPGWSKRSMALMAALAGSGPASPLTDILADGMNLLDLEIKDQPQAPPNEPGQNENWRS